MGYLDNTSLTVDAILTKKGRELLAKGELEITKFALADDEIDYRLWDVGHDQGSDKYGEAIEALPMLEAFPLENQMMKYKLISLGKNTLRLPVLETGLSSITLQRPGSRQVITPATANISNGNSVLGYTATLGNSDYAILRVAQGGSIGSATTSDVLGDDAKSISVTGLRFEVVAKQLTSDSTTTLTITANETGGSVDIPITIKKDASLDILA
tara:strand:+ start:1561 stop:2199 length:639 start_codon:yes stop_codon:yes gene_type:complete